MCGCGNKVTETKNESTQAAEDVSSDDRKIKTDENRRSFSGNLFLSKQKKSNLNVIWKCRKILRYLIFDKPIIKGITYTDPEKIYENMVR